MTRAIPSEETLRKACEAVAERYPGVSWQEIRGKDKGRRIAHARQEAWALLIEQGYGLAPIARRWGCDHTTIVHARKRVLEREGAAA